MQRSGIAPSRLTYVGAFILGVMPEVSCGELRSHDEVAGEPSLKANAADLKHTIVTPYLEQEIPADSNVLWCGTFQLAWNELGKLTGGEVILEPSSPLSDVLNRQTTTKRDFDRSSYVAVAGLASSRMQQKIQRELNQRFAGRSDPNLLRSLGRLPEGGLVAYAYLFKDLPFRWSFSRFYNDLQFQAHKVDCFGIRHSGGDGGNRSRMASQVAVLDYVDNDDFIVEIQTESKADRLLLAKMPPCETLSETIDAAELRIETAEPTPILNGTDLIVPVFNFDLLQRYQDLEDRRLSRSSNRFAGKELQVAAQSIRFRLDERGAVLKSEAFGGAGALADQNLIFDKPFLVLLQRKRAENPYFALWVGNAELMVSQRQRPGQ